MLSHVLMNVLLFGVCILISITLLVVADVVPVANPIVEAEIPATGATATSSVGTATNVAADDASVVSPCATMTSCDSLPRIMYPYRRDVNKAAPKDIPADLIDYYTRCGCIQQESFYVDDTNRGQGTHYRFNQETINGMIEKAEKLSRGVQPAKHKKIFMAMNSHNKNIRNQTVLVIGSIEPWYEAILLAHGATEVITIEYNKLTYNHPFLRTMTPDEFRLGRTGQHPNITVPRRYAAILAISCIDHDGLGRYGDPLAPDGDLLDMDEIRTWMKPNGLLFLAVPLGSDLVVWNLHRRYGPTRLPLLLEGWDEVAKYGYKENRLNSTGTHLKRNEPIFVLHPKAAKPSNKSKSPPKSADTTASTISVPDTTAPATHSTRDEL